jgi:ketosteroid isomerase-like protein
MKTKSIPSRGAQFCAFALAVFATDSSLSAALPAHDEAAIRAQSKKYVELVCASDWKNLVNVHAEAAVFMPPNERELNGRKEILAWHAALPPIKAFTLEILDLDGNADVAFVRGRYSVANDMGYVDAGKYIEVWRKQRDGSWQIHRDIFNSDKPAPTAAASTPGSGPSTAIDTMLEGTWELNVAKSRFSPGPGPRSETRTYSMTADGQQRAIYDQVDAEGKRTRGESIYRLDSRDAPITGNPEIDAQAISRTGPRSISGVLKKAGKVVRTATREVSEEGNAMTLRFKGVNAKGQPLDDTWVFDRKAGTDEQVIAQIEKEWGVALEKGDADYIASITTSDWARTSTEGKLNTKAEVMAAFRSGAIRIETFQLDDLKVLCSGDTAVALGLVTARGSVDGKGFSGQSRFTDTFAKRDRRWICIASHGSKVEKAGEDIATAVKAAVDKHWAAINAADGSTIVGQHTWDMNLIGCEFDQHVKFNTPLGLAIGKRFEGAKANWRLGEVEIQPVGNAALAIFNLTGSIRWADGSVDSRPRRVTEVWVNENGTWKEAHHHDSVYVALPKAMASQ